MVDSVRGTHQRQQSLATVRDLIGQRAFEHTARPQSTAVVQVHVQRPGAGPATTADDATGPRSLYFFFTVKSQILYLIPTP